MMSKGHQETFSVTFLQSSEKNNYSKLRLNGTDIYRPVSEEEYMEECGQVFIQMMDCLKDNGLEDAIHVLAKAIITGKKSIGNNHQI